MEGRRCHDVNIMSYQRTQIYLDAEDHRRLKLEAGRRGQSLTGLLREIVARHVRERVAPYRPLGFDTIIGIARGPVSDVARDERELRDAALDARFKRKLGGRRARRKSGRRRGVG